MLWLFQLCQLPTAQSCFLPFFFFFCKYYYPVCLFISFHLCVCYQKDTTWNTHLKENDHFTDTETAPLSWHSNPDLHNSNFSFLLNSSARVHVGLVGLALCFSQSLSMRSMWFAWQDKSVTLQKIKINGIDVRAHWPNPSSGVHCALGLVPL